MPYSPARQLLREPPPALLCSALLSSAAVSATFGTGCVRCTIYARMVHAVCCTRLCAGAGSKGLHLSDKGMRFANTGMHFANKGTRPCTCSCSSSRSRSSRSSRGSPDPAPSTGRASCHAARDRAVLRWGAYLIEHVDRRREQFQNHEPRVAQVEPVHSHTPSIHTQAFTHAAHKQAFTHASIHTRSTQPSI